MASRSISSHRGNPKPPPPPKKKGAHTHTHTQQSKGGGPVLALPEARTKEQEAKQKQMEARPKERHTVIQHGKNLRRSQSVRIEQWLAEAALVLMAAGASTEDVDEMLAARRM